MSVNPNKRAVEEKVFAHKLLEHGMNATEAMQDMKPQLTPDSANVAGSRMLARVSQSGAIDNLMQNVKDCWSSEMKKAIALAGRWIESDSEQLQQRGMDYIRLVGSLFAPASSTPKNLTQINKYTLPKR